MSQEFIPHYRQADLESLFRNWFHKSLDGIHSRGNVAVGVKDCDRGSHGFQASGLLQRYTSEEFQHVLYFMTQEAQPMPTYATLLIHTQLEQRPIQDIARAWGYTDCSQAIRAVNAASDEFMRRLLAT
jgi:hypothetical protein